MAIDVYLHIDGIRGESRDSVHKDWMECALVDFGGVHQPVSAVPSSCGHATGRCHHDTIDLYRLSDIASPLLLQYCCAGKTFAKARIEVMRSDGPQRIAYYVVQLEHVLIAGVYPEVSSGTPMSEYLTLAFGKIRWAYAQQKVGGGIVGRTVGGWDLTTNTRLT